MKKKRQIENWIKPAGLVWVATVWIGIILNNNPSELFVGCGVFISITIFMIGVIFCNLEKIKTFLNTWKFPNNQNRPIVQVKTSAS